MLFSKMMIFSIVIQFLYYILRLSFSIVCCLVLNILLPSPTFAQTDSEAANKALRIITLSPHLTEMVFALGKGEHLVAVSDYSDFPETASDLKSVASYQGANIAEIVRLQPSHVLVWRGGNKDADIEKLKALNISVYESSIDSVESLLDDIAGIGVYIFEEQAAQTLIQQLTNSINAMAVQYTNASINVVYFLSTQPLVGLGNDKWLNSLLGLCGITNVYANSPSAYPQLQLPDIIRRQPNMLIAASKANRFQLAQFWAAHKAVLTNVITHANPDALHRFTPRAIAEMTQLCERVYAEPTLK
jgi:vitamin B12 transport system substrate-binding protein